MNGYWKLPGSVWLAICLAAFGAASCESSAETDPVRTAQDGGVLPPLSPACKNDSECSGKRCDPLSGCVDCLFDSQCGTGFHCSAGKCEATATCATSKDCAGTAHPACDVVSKECVGCLADTDCGKNELCTDRKCQPFVPCVNSLDCPADKVCDRNLHKCVGCVTVADCGDAGNLCVESTCMSKCTSDKECAPSGRLCDMKVGHCVQCVQQVDCPAVYHCAAGKCLLDVCAKDEVKCTPTGTGAASCNAVGDGYDLTPCPPSSSCAKENGKLTCKAWVCNPESSKCDAEHKNLDTCSIDGLSVAKRVDCTAMGKVCSADACRDKICEPKATFCKDQTSMRCSDDGASSTSLQVCGTGTFCDPATGECKPQACVPGSKTCNGNVATTCASDGSGMSPGGTDCDATSTRCFQGECKPKVCEPNSTSCKANDLYECLDNGTREALKNRCSIGYYCDGAASPAACRIGVCTANVNGCDGNVAAPCKSDGSGFLPGTDCTATNQVCSSGSCVAKVCEPQSYYCKAGGVYICVGNGASENVYKTCSASTFCDTTQSPPTCTAVRCTANGPACNGSVATTCNADGSGYAAGGTDCAASSKVCVNGSCLPKICEPSSYFCSSGNVQHCGSTGATSTLFATCAASQFCTDGVSYCQSDVCTASQPTCSGDLLSTCKADGSGAVEGGTDCTVNHQVCETGQCKAVVCTANQYFCSGGNVALCNTKGTASSISSYCATNQYCDSSSTPICRADVCTQGAPACAGETLAVCNADGSGYASMTTNCAVSNQVCALAQGPACAATAVDTVGSNTFTTSAVGTLYGTGVSVTAARKLTQIEGYFASTGTSLFTWVVYSSASASGTYTKIFELTTSSSGTTFHGSGPINVALEKGKFYVIGVIATGVTAYYYSPGTSPQTPVSFGVATAGASYSAGSGAPATVTYPPSSSYYYSYSQRFTTALP